MITPPQVITIIKLGYYHPSTANWNYGIHLIIDDTGAKLYKETFGEDSRLIHRLENAGITVKELYVMETASYKWAEVGKMPDIENYIVSNRI